ncbi:hypothetical protein CASFOL_039902 [Castilleja foliolosa]|uniref:B box-type domain-containing protein n=1 Tax=Castilleja foliolosa TaxID=1961234 RepID=A0ABD3BGU1_9LAMI
MPERNSDVPEWLSALLTEKFFNACIVHEDERKNDKNVFCLDCCEGICPHCLADHRSHRLFVGNGHLSVRLGLLVGEGRPTRQVSTPIGQPCPFSQPSRPTVHLSQLSRPTVHLSQPSRPTKFIFNTFTIRRYVYNDVIRLVDAEKLMDCAHVQSYINNSAKVVFLKQRPQTRAAKNSGNLCVTCDRRLQELSLYCSIYCKVEHVIGNGCELSMYLRKCEFLALPDPGSEDGQMTPDSVLEPAGLMWTESGSSSGLMAGLVECPNLICTATTEIAKKKRSSLSTGGFRPACKPASDMPTRRKSTPQRSPLH